jgi:hypothetical protein
MHNWRWISVPLSIVTTAIAHAWLALVIIGSAVGALVLSLAAVVFTSVWGSETRRKAALDTIKEILSWSRAR